MVVLTVLAVVCAHHPQGFVGRRPRAGELLSSTTAGGGPLGMCVCGSGHVEVTLWVQVLSRERLYDQPALGAEIRVCMLGNRVRDSLT